MKVCEEHIKLSGLHKRQLEIVGSEECELCNMEEYFKTHGYNHEELRAMNMRGSC